MAPPPLAYCFSNLPFAINIDTPDGRPTDWVIRGTNQVPSHELVDGFAMTDIPAAIVHEWFTRKSWLPFIVNGNLYYLDSIKAGKSEASKREGIKSGFEPVKLDELESETNAPVEANKG